MALPQQDQFQFPLRFGLETANPTILPQPDGPMQHQIQTVQQRTPVIDDLMIDAPFAEMEIIVSPSIRESALDTQMNGGERDYMQELEREFSHLEYNPITQELERELPHLEDNFVHQLTMPHGQQLEHTQELEKEASPLEGNETLQPGTPHGQEVEKEASPLEGNEKLLPRAVFEETDGSRPNAVPETKHISFSSTSNKKSKGYPSAYAVQCVNCFKFRFIPTTKQYEEIRQNFVEVPFVCKTALAWRPSITCDDEPDLVHNGSWRWALDIPCIPQTPADWKRIISIRRRGGTKFADTYLNTYPELSVTLSQFSFQCPIPLEKNNVRKKCSRATLQDMSNVVVPVVGESTNLHFDGEGDSTQDADAHAEVKSGISSLQNPHAGSRGKKRKA